VNTQPVGSVRVPEEAALQAWLGRLGATAAEAVGGGPQGWNAWAAGAAYAVSAGTGIRTQELVKVQARDVSIKFGCLIIWAPKAGAPRVVPLGRVLLSWLDPLVDALRRTGQDEALCFSIWRDQSLTPPTPRALNSLARALVGPNLPPLALGQLRHWYISRVEAEAWEREGEPGDFEMDRWRSALVGHGQSGGWSIHLPQRFARAHKDLVARQDNWFEPAPQLGSLPFVPPQFASDPLQPRAGEPAQARSARDWVLSGLNRNSPSLDLMSEIRPCLWKKASDLGVGTARLRTMAALAAIELVAFGDILFPDWYDRLRALEWSQWRPGQEGVGLRFGAGDGPPPLLVWGGPTVQMLGESLRRQGEPRPFASLDPAVVRDLLRRSTDFPGPDPMGQLQRANTLLHLFTHATDEIGYLEGRLPRTVSLGELRSPTSRRRVPDYGLGGLRQRLQGWGRRVSPVEFGRLCREFAGPGTDPEAKVKKKILGSMRLVYQERDKSRKRRSRSPHTLLGYLTDLCLIAAADSAGDDSAAAGNAAIWGPSPTGGARRRAAERVWREYHGSANLPVAEGSTAVTGPAARSVLPLTWDELDQGLAETPHDVRPTLALYICMATHVRSAELPRVLSQDIVSRDPTHLCVWVTWAKGGRSRWANITVPSNLQELVAQALSNFQAGEPAAPPVVASLVSGDLSARKLTTAVQRRLARAGCAFHPHAMRTLWATTADREGMDRSQISAELAHVLVETTTTHYVVLDDDRLRASGADLTAATDWVTALSIANLMWARGISRRQAERDHAILVAAVVEHNHERRSLAA